MLDPDQPMQGKADHVISANHGTLVHYIGNAQVWQGGSKIVGGPDRHQSKREVADS